MLGFDQKRGGWRGVFMALAVLALFMKIAAPPGFMIAAPGSGAGFPLVICTGHGPLTATSDHKGGPAKSRADAPCAFAGHAAPPTPAVGPEITLATFVHAAALIVVPFDLLPGRGLAAPPPPSQGPPIPLV